MSGVLILAGQTGIGKTELAIALAERFDGEIVGADSRQIYRDMPIGTAAPAPAQLARVPHHLVGFVDPQARYSAAQFVADATQSIARIHDRGKRAIVTGGTGFYIRALTGDVELAPQGDAAVRERLAREARVHDRAFLHEWLSVRAPARAALVHPQDRYRVLRALEIALTAGEPARAAPLPSLARLGIPFVKIFLHAADSTVLDQRIARRTDTMLERGFVEEAESVGAGAVAASAVGYPQALAYLRGWLTRAELRNALVALTRRYAKRQATWFRSEPQTVWIEHGEAASRVPQMAREILGWA